MHITRHGRSLKKAALIITALMAFLVAFALPFYTRHLLDTKVAYYTISINGVKVGAANSENDANKALARARQKLASQYSTDVYMNPDVKITEESKSIAKRSSVDELTDKIYSYLFDNVIEVKRDFDYTLKIDDYTTTLSSLDEIAEVLNSVVAEYDSLSQYKVSIVASDLLDGGYKVKLVKATDKSAANDIVAAAIGGDGTTVADATDVTNEGIVDIYFKENVSIIAIPEGLEAVSSVDDAFNALTKVEKVNDSYTVAEGESLSFIASKYGVSTADLVSLNPKITESTILVAGDIITVPKPTTLLTVVSTKRMSFQENYNETANLTEDNTRNKYDNLVTNEGKTGNRYTEADIVYYNNIETSRNYIQLGMYITDEASPKSISVGTVANSDFMRPLKSPSGSYIKGLGEEGSINGVVWNTDPSTEVLAAADGTVTKASWYSDYGYMVEITHADGTITRYGHLSEINVAVADTVTKGAVIAKTGSTGGTSEDGLLFEIWKNGKAVNPLDYVNKN